MRPADPGKLEWKSYKEYPSLVKVYLFTRPFTYLSPVFVSTYSRCGPFKIEPRFGLIAFVVIF